MACHTSIPVSVNIFDDAVSGDFVDESALVEWDGADETLNRVIINFKTDPSAATTDKTLDSDVSQVTISGSGAGAWAFLVEGFQNDLTAGDNYYQAHCYSGVDNRRTTLLEGFFVSKPSI